MGGFLKNVFVTALIVCVATVASVTIAFVISLLVGMPAEQPAAPVPLVGIIFGLMIAVAMAMLTGMLFCMLTLIIAAFTMPPVIWLARWLDLPRPLVDIAGGALAAWFCVAIGMEEADSLAQYGMTLPEPIFASVGIVLGGLAGYVRFQFLGRRAPASMDAASALPAG
ncbi:MAG: hypothetical protein NW206_02985 [Hyphomonadaceae bacterium]|nr:hypothetical protein [Hyphomonadaceae bacterium]